MLAIPGMRLLLISASVISLAALWHAAPFAPVRKEETRVLNVTKMEPCRLPMYSKSPHRHIVPVRGCYETPSGEQLFTCRHASSAHCFKPTPTDHNAVLRGEPWTVHAVRDKSRRLDKWRVYAIFSADGRPLRTHEKGIQAWGQWNPLGVILAFVTWIVAGFLALVALGTRERPLTRSEHPR